MAVTGLSANTTYRFIVLAKNDCGWGETYNCASATTAPGVAPITSLSRSLDFGSVQLNNTPQRTLTISNTGTATLNVSSIDFPDGFTDGWNGGTGITPSASKEVTVTFSPLLAQSYGGNITVNSDATGTNTITCSGTGIMQLRHHKLHLQILLIIIRRSQCQKYYGRVQQGKMRRLLKFVLMRQATPITFVNNKGINSDNIRFLINSICHLPKKAV